MDSQDKDKPSSDDDLFDEQTYGINVPRDDDDDDLSNIPSWIDEEETALSDDLSELEGLFDEELAEFTNQNSAKDQDASIAEISEQRDAFRDALQQLQADFENYKKRVIRDQEEDTYIKSDKLIEDLLPVLDNFSHALDAISQDDEVQETLRKGIELLQADLMSVLERQGLEVVNEQGVVFDPEVHDAIHHEDIGEHEHEIVVEVLRPGYKLRGRIIRPAMVKVAR